MNRIKTVVLLSLLTVLLLLIGNAIGGTYGMTLAFIFAAVMNFGAWWFSDKIVLAMYRAREVAPDEAPYLHRIVEELAAQAGIPKPRVYIVPMQQPNAFATGRSPGHAAVAVTEGMLRLVDEEELKGVLAHEMAHVLNRDTLVSAVAATIAGAVMMIARWLQYLAIFGALGGRDNEGNNPIVLLIMAIVAPIAAILIQMAISRSREYMADATGAKLAGSPFGLARALKKLDAYSHRLPAEVNPATSHMFIVNPLRGGSSLSSLFSTHPPIEERIKRLVGENYATIL